MKRIAIVAVLAVAALIGYFVLVREPAPTQPAQPVATEQTAPAPDTIPAEEPADVDAEQPQMVEESAAEDDPAQAEEQPIILAQADTNTAPQEWKYTEGTHFARMVPTQPTVGGADKIEVAEFFWYGCGHCYNFETYVTRWLENKPANARFVRVPAVWNPLVKLHAQLYYTEEVLAKNGKLANPEQFRAAVFAEYHTRGNRMGSEAAIQSLFETHGVSAEDFSSTWK